MKLDLLVDLVVLLKFHNIKLIHDNLALLGLSDLLANILKSMLVKSNVPCTLGTKINRIPHYWVALTKVYTSYLKKKKNTYDLDCFNFKFVSWKWKLVEDRMLSNLAIILWKLRSRFHNHEVEFLLNSFLFRDFWKDLSFWSLSE